MATSHIYKKIELVGSSPIGTDDAIQKAVAKAATSIKHIDWFEVLETRGHIVDGKIAHYQVTIKLGFRIED